MKNRIVRTAMILSAAAATLFYCGCSDNGAGSGVTGDGKVDNAISRYRGTNDPKVPDLYALGVTASPEDGGSVYRNPDQEQYTDGESVLLTVDPAPEYRFIGWSGSQTAPTKEMIVIMNADKNIFANFLPRDAVTYTLAVDADNGTVHKSPDWSEYRLGDAVQVTAAPAPGYVFTGWSGASASKDPVETVTMDADKYLIANFAPQTYTLAISVYPQFSGFVSSDPGKSAYSYSDAVTVTATPVPGYEFIGWSGASLSAEQTTEQTITVTIEESTELTANFQWIEGSPLVPPTQLYTLTAVPNIENWGTASWAPYKTGYSANEQVSVTAEAAHGYRFVRWNGASSSAEQTITITVSGNMTLTAVFESIPATTYSLTINVIGGGMVSPSAGAAHPYVAGMTATVTATPNHGYRFAGWSGASDGTGTSTEILMDGDKNVTATFELITYTVTFDANGGNVTTETGTTGEGGTLAPLPTPTRDGYKFTGWFTAASGGTQVTENRVYSEDATVYAQWTPIYTVTFNANGGSGTRPEPMTADSGYGVKLPNQGGMAKDEYSFGGWSDNSAGTGTAYSAGSSYTPRGNVTLYAKWVQAVTPPTVETFVDSRDGKTYKKVKIDSQTWMAENLDYNASGSKCYGEDGQVNNMITLSNSDVQANCNKYGRLYNWSTAMDLPSSYNSSYTSGQIQTPHQGICPAGWHVPSDDEWDIFIRFVHANDETYNRTDNYRGNEAGAKLKSSSGWDWSDNFGVSGNGTDEYGFSALPGGYRNGGSGFYEAGDAGYWWSATEGTRASDAWNRGMGIETKTVFGHSTGKGFLFSVRCVQGGSAAVTTYTVTFVTNGGSGSVPGPQTVNAGSSITIPEASSLVKSGYTFGGWSANTDGTGTSYDAGSSYTPTGNVTLYAKWDAVSTPTPTTYTVTFDINGGTGTVPAAQTVYAGVSVMLPGGSDLSKSGYTFGGWNTNSDGTGTNYSAGSSYTPTGAVTLYVKWNAIGVPTPTKTPFVDDRDGKTYNKVTIGTQTWMAENLNYDDPIITTDACYDNNPDSCAKYGRLYDWYTAMGGANSSTAVPSGVQGVCPVGWHLPSDDELEILVNYVGGYEIAGTKLKSETGWNNNGSVTDEYGFSALPGGFGGGGSFYSAGFSGLWWSATEGSDSMAWYRYSGGVYVGREPYSKANLLSVRCVQNN